MARHQAADHAAPHPLVEAALRRRAHEARAAPHRHEQLPGQHGPVGWPGPRPDEQGEPVGWPGGLPAGPGSDHTEQDEQPDDEPEHSLLGRATAV